ncbi:MAG: winged helix-turn-helix transcriptional regulator [Thermoplasmatota archaeon]
MKRAAPEREPSKQHLILAAIANNPGIHKSELRRMLDLGWGTVAYHIHALQGRNLVKVQSHGREARLFTTGVSAQQMAWLAATRHPVHASILERLADRPGIRASDLGAALGLRPNTVRRHLSTMGESGIVAWEGVHGRRYFVKGKARPPADAGPEPDAQAARHYDGDGTRERILAAVQAEPGIHTSELTRATGVTWGNLAHHLRILESQGHLAKGVHGSRTCYFAPSVPERERALLVARRNEVSSLILDALGREGGLMQQEIVRRTGARTSTVERYLHHLVEEQLVRPDGTRFELADETFPEAAASFD